MNDLAALVIQAQSGDPTAYGTLIRRVHKMAVGYSYALLGDFHLAEDAVQEACLDVYRHLKQLRTPEAFPGWFRKALFKHCDRLRRGLCVETIPLETAGEIASDAANPAEYVLQSERRTSVRQAVTELPELSRTVATLFYLADTPQQEIAEFLEVPVTTVRKRLQYARTQLRARLTFLLEARPRENQPATLVWWRLGLLYSDLKFILRKRHLS